MPNRHELASDGALPERPLMAKVSEELQSPCLPSCSIASIQLGTTCDELTRPSFPRIRLASCIRPESPVQVARSRKNVELWRFLRDLLKKRVVTAD